MSFMLVYQRVCPCMIQLLKTKGHFVAKAMLGKNGAQHPHSIIFYSPKLVNHFYNIQTRGHTVQIVNSKQ